MFCLLKGSGRGSGACRKCSWWESQIRKASRVKREPKSAALYEIGQMGPSKGSGRGSATGVKMSNENKAEQ
jgi:hypothetical protein